MTTERDLEKAPAKFDHDGFVVLENAIESALVSELKEALLKTERDLGLTGRDTDFEGRQTIRIYNLLAHGQTYWKVPTHDAVLPVPCRQHQRSDGYESERFHGWQWKRFPSGWPVRLYQHCRLE